MRYEILIAKAASAADNMERDSALLQSLAEHPRCVLHLYDWEQPSATYGYFIDPDNYFNQEGLNRRQMQLARRPTGGGIIFHTCDLAYSVLIPATHPTYSLNPLENYALINRAVSDAIAANIAKPLELLPLQLPSSGFDAFCMATPTRYDVMLEGRKVGGAAQRRMKQGYLHQGSIALGLPEADLLQDVLESSGTVADAMLRHGYALLGSTYEPEQLEDARRSLRELLIKSLRQYW
ncbi:MAG: hypothetical protein LLG04_01910 [Parachlamydia sp.]|nr:hypothetical protein [Parachlamydia sp.]